MVKIVDKVLAGSIGFLLGKEYEKHKDAIHQMAKNFAEALLSRTRGSREGFTFRGVTFEDLAVEGLTDEEQSMVYTLLSDPAVFREFMLIELADELLGDQIERVKRLYEYEDAKGKFEEIERLYPEGSWALRITILGVRREIGYYEFVINTPTDQIVKILSDINAAYPRGEGLADFEAFSKRIKAFYKVMGIEKTYEEEAAYVVHKLVTRGETLEAAKYHYKLLASKDPKFRKHLEENRWYYATIYGDDLYDM